MFCKWCGNSIQLTDKKCPTCGRETPPMSDCGGFYNLKHSNDGPTAPTTEKVIVKEVPHCAAVEKMEVKYIKERKAAKKHHTITIFCFIVVLLAIVCSTLLVLSVNNQMDELKEQIENIQIEVPTYPTAPSSEETTGEQEDDPPAESTQYCFTINTTVINGDPKEISNTYDFGNYAKSVKVTTITAEGENGQAFTVSYLLDEEASVDLNLKYVQEDTELLTIGVKCDTDLSFFYDQDFSYEWQYRSSIGNWTSADADIITVDDENYCLIVCTRDWLKNITIMKQPIELQCIVRIENKVGNSMQITVDGISVAADGTIINNNQ